MSTFLNHLVYEAARMRNIPHIDQMKPDDLFKLLDSENWEVTEKVDGSNVSIGITQDNGETKVYIKSKKGKPITEPAEFERMAAAMNNDIMLGFADLLRMLQQNNEKVVGFFKHLYTTLNGRPQIFGELFSRSQMNVIAYSSELIGNGAVVIFGIVHDEGGGGPGVDYSETQTDQRAMQACVKEFNGMSGWRFYYKRPVQLSIRKLYRNAVKQFIDEYGPALKNRKRDPESKRLKQEAKDKFVQISTHFKRELLRQIRGVPSFLGAKEIEGVIIRNMQNGAIAKLVDIEEFGRRRAEAWAGVDALKGARKALYKNILTTILKNADIFMLPAKQQEKLSNAIEERGRPFDYMSEILKVMYGDASEEVQFDKAEEMVNQLKQILFDHLQGIEEVLGQVNPNDAKAVQDTQNAIVAEKQRITQFISTLDEVMRRGDTNPYLDVIQFVLGPKALEEIKQQYLQR